MERDLYIRETTDNWAYTTASFRSTNGADTNCFEYISCDASNKAKFDVYGLSSGNNGVATASGIGIDSTTVNSAKVFGITANVTSGEASEAKYSGYPGLGYHKITWLEYGGAGVSFYGDVGNATSYQAGMTGIVFG